MPLKHLTRFEQKNDPVATRTQFAWRMATNLAAALALVFVSLLIGMAGYAYFEGLGIVDAYLNASMILGGMGPVATMQTVGGKLFAATYALYSGIVLIFSTGIILAPVLHRVLHEFHVDDEDGDTPSRRHPNA